MAASMDECETMSALCNVSENMCTVEATVNTGLQYTASEEVKEKIKDSIVSISRGRLLIKLPKSSFSEILKLRSIDNCWVVMNFYPDLSIPQDELEAMRFLRQLVPDIDWKTGLEIWNSVFSFPYDIAAVPENSAYDLGEPIIVVRKTMQKKKDFKINRQEEILENMACNQMTGDVLCDEKNRRKTDAMPDLVQESDGDAVKKSAGPENNNTVTKTNPSKCAALERKGEVLTPMFEINERDTINNEQKTQKNPKVPTFRVTCNRTGTSHRFDSMCAAANFGGAIYNYFTWNVNMKNFDIEVILNIDENTVSVCLSLTKESLHRRHISVFGPTTLRPTIAYNMLRLCEIQPGDVICDPMCGGGTIPIEAAVNWPNAVHIAGEIHYKALDRIEANVNLLNKKRLLTNRSSINVDIIKWDTTRLPFHDNSIDVFVTDLPFGKRMGYRGDNWKLYPRILLELARTCKRSTGRACFLTQDRKCITKSMTEVKRFWKRQTTLWTRVGGLEAGVFLLHRTAVPV